MLALDLGLVQIVAPCSLLDPGGGGGGGAGSSGGGEGGGNGGDGVSGEVDSGGSGGAVNVKQGKGVDGPVGSVGVGPGIMDGGEGQESGGNASIAANIISVGDGAEETVATTGAAVRALAERLAAQVSIPALSLQEDWLVAKK